MNLELHKLVVEVSSKKENVENWTMIVKLSSFFALATPDFHLPFHSWLAA